MCTAEPARQFRAIASAGLIRSRKTYGTGQKNKHHINESVYLLWIIQFWGILFIFRWFLSDPQIVSKSAPSARKLFAQTQFIGANQVQMRYAARSSFEAGPIDVLHSQMRRKLAHFVTTELQDMLSMISISMIPISMIPISKATRESFERSCVVPFFKMIIPRSFFSVYNFPQSNFGVV